MREIEEWTDEMYDALDTIESENMCLEEICKHCPLSERCQKEELFWGCHFWENSMGDDL